MPEWIVTTLTALPAMVWVVVGVGLPWSLAVLPRRDWPDRAMVACVALAAGPAWLTLWMFVLGTLGQNNDPLAGQTLNPVHTSIMTHTGGQNLMRPDLILGGTGVIALAGAFFAWRKLRYSDAADAIQKHPPAPLAPDERILIGFIILATFTRWFITAWLPFGSWDPLWVYGYQSRIYTLTGYIPADIGYYPQFIPLQYAYMQIMTQGAISDTAARVVMPFMQMGSILAVYILGSRLFNRRTGIIAAALWALYPHFGYWTRVGDLEIPVTFGFTGAAAFFLIAWTLPQKNRVLRWHYATIAGLFFGVAMWTKPTAGAFVWGVLLLLVVELLRVGNLRAWRPRFEVAFFTGLACIPLGAVWYVRNVLAGHDAIVFPPSFWLDKALRSGGEFGWPLLGLALLLAYLHIGPARPRPDWRLTLFGVVLIAIGVTPTILQPDRMGWWEWLAFLSGVGVMAVHLGIYALAYAPNWSAENKSKLHKVGWAALLAFPYFVTWFYSYSYHYRLSFAIVPLMLLPAAVILAHWFRPELQKTWRFPRRFAYAAMVIALCLPGTMIFIYDEGLGWDWLWTIPEEGDFSQAALLGVVETLQHHIDTTGEQPIVIAPGLQTLPFFFPEAEIRIVETPTRIGQVEGVDYFVNSREAIQTYEANSDPLPFQNQWFASLPRQNVTEEVAVYQDEGFFYTIYRLHPEKRFEQPEVMFPTPGDIQFGDFVRLTGHDLTNSNLYGGFWLTFIWESLGPAPQDYNLFIHLIRPDDPDTVLDGWDGPVAPWQFGYYSPAFWEDDEYIIDPRVIFPRDPDLPEADNYQIRVGFYDVETGERVPVTINGTAAGDGYILGTTFIKQPPS